MSRISEKMDDCSCETDLQDLAAIVDQDMSKYHPEKVLLIIINSSPLNFELRKLVRHTWIKILTSDTEHIRSKVDYRFFISRPSNATKQSEQLGFTAADIAKVCRSSSHGALDGDGHSPSFLFRHPSMLTSTNLIQAACI